MSEPSVQEASADSDENTGVGAAVIVAAFFVVAVMSAFGKLAGDLPTNDIVFFQSFISLLIFAPWALRHGVAALKTAHPFLHILRAVGGLLSQALMFVAIKKMPLMNAVLLSNSAPLFIPLVAWIWLKEKIGGMTWVSLLIGFVGIVFILKPGRSLVNNPSSAIALLAALCSAIALVIVNRLSISDSTDRILFYYFFISTLLTALLLPLGWRRPDGKDWIYLAGIGVCMALSQLLIILAYRHAKPARIAPFNYSVVIFSGLIGWLIWHNTPGMLALVGVVLVSIGGILSTFFGGPNSRGHLLWVGHWNLPFHHRDKQEQQWRFLPPADRMSNAS